MRSFVSSLVPTFDASSNAKVQKTAGSATSRSTSAGSSTAPSSPEETVAMPSTVPALQRQAAQVIPEYDYPVPWVVKNTFIDMNGWQPSSLDGFLRERQIQSCVSRIGAPPGLVHIKRPEALEEAAMPTMPVFSSYCSNEDTIDGPEFFDALENFPGYEHNMLQMRQLPMVPPPPPPPAHWPAVELLTPFIPPPPKAPVLRLAEALPEPELGTPDLPTIGSAGHHLGNCKPCAFFHTKGCAQGPQCEFCHLCIAGERKKRRKEKLTLVRESRASQQAFNCMPNEDIYRP